MEADDYGRARSQLEAGQAVVLSCAQKVCLSGDYGDMCPGTGTTLTASLDVRPTLRVWALGPAADGASTVMIEGKPLPDNFPKWPLVQRFRAAAGTLTGTYAFDVTPTEHRRVGLGSSGAASVLFAAALAVLRGGSPTDETLIWSANEFERNAGFPCGPQDHAAAVFGGLNLIEFPSLSYQKIPDAPIWPTLSFWTSDQRRRAREVIPSIVRHHSAKIWTMKAAITEQIAAACSAGDVPALIDGLRREFLVQKQLKMLTRHQRRAVAAVEAIGGGAKVSGAGKGGVLVVAARTPMDRDRIDKALARFHFRELALSVDGRGLDCTPDGAGMS